MSEEIIIVLDGVITFLLGMLTVYVPYKIINWWSNRPLKEREQ